jgi:hypothetical protein
MLSLRDSEAENQSHTMTVRKKVHSVAKIPQPRCKATKTAQSQPQLAPSGSNLGGIAQKLGGHCCRNSIGSFDIESAAPLKRITLQCADSVASQRHVIRILATPV